MSGAVPKLRFAGFVGEWDKSPLRKYARVKGGYAFKSENFSPEGIPVVRISNISAESGFVDLDGAVKHPKVAAAQNFRVVRGDILIALSGATTGKTCVYNLDSPAYLNQRVGLLKRASECLQYEYLETLVFSQLFASQLKATLVAGAQPNISPKDIEGFEFGFPTLPEQQKIAAFLGAVDGRLAGLRRVEAGLVRFKAGLMQRLFSQTLRFTQDDGSAFPDWKKRKLSYLMVEQKDRNRELKFSKENVLSVSGDLGCINQIEHLGRSYAGVSVKDYHIVKRGDVVYTKSPLKKAPYGIIKANFGVDGIVSTLYAVYRPTEKAITEYIHYYFELDDNLNGYLRSIVRKGAKNDMKVNNSDVLKDYIWVPHPDEQRKIAAALSALDARISATRAQIAKTDGFKAGLLQQMFV